MRIAVVGSQFGMLILYFAPASGQGPPDPAILHFSKCKKLRNQKLIGPHQA